MSDHEKVFGVCENKCFVEVRPKSDTYHKNDVYNKTEINSLRPKFVSISPVEGTLTTKVHTNDTMTANGLIPIPTGFDSSNCMPVLFIKFNNQTWEQAFNQHRNYQSQILEFQCKWQSNEILGESVGVKAELHDFDGAVFATSLFPIAFGVLFVPFNE